MEDKIIVVYKSSTGFTKKYAEWIAEEVKGTLADHRTVTAQMLSEYEVVVFGSRAHAGMIDGYKKARELFQKSAAGSQVQVTAAASQSIAEVITKEELLDGLGNVLSSAEVYIPVTGAVQLNYRITVREGTNGNETNY